MQKIFLIGSDKRMLKHAANALCAVDDSLDIAESFTSDESAVREGVYWRQHSDVCLDYKNNVLLYVGNPSGEAAEGMTIDEMLNKAVVCLTYDDWFSIAPSVLTGIDGLICWIDSDSSSEHTSRHDIASARAFAADSGSLPFPMLYFTSSEDFLNIARTVIEWANSDEERRKMIEEENS